MIDIVVIALVVVLSFKGFFNGAVREAVGFFGLIGGVFVASRAATPLAELLHGTLHMGSMALLKLAVFLAVFALIWGGSAFVATIFTALRAQPHTSWSRWGGMGIAGAKYFLIFSLIAASLLGNALVRDNIASRIRGSRLLPVMERVGGRLINLSSLEAGTRAAAPKPHRS